MAFPASTPWENSGRRPWGSILIYGLHFPEVRRGWATSSNAYFPVIPSSYFSPVNILMKGEERLIYKVGSSYFSFSGPSLSEDTLIKEILGRDPASLKPAPLSPLGLRGTSVGEVPCPLERADSAALLQEALRGQPCFISCDASPQLIGQSGCLSQGQPTDWLVNDPRGALQQKRKR